MSLSFRLHTFLPILAFYSTHTRSKARERRTNTPLWPSKGKGNIREVQDARSSSPWNPSWSPGCTRSFYSNQNGCRHPWRPRDPGSPWQPSGSDKLGPSCTGTRKSGMSGTAETQSQLRSWLCGLLSPGQKKEGKRHALKTKKHNLTKSPNKV